MSDTLYYVVSNYPHLYRLEACIEQSEKGKCVKHIQRSYYSDHSQKFKVPEFIFKGSKFDYCVQPDISLETFITTVFSKRQIVLYYTDNYDDARFFMSILNSTVM